MADFLDQRASEDGHETTEGVGILVSARSYLDAISFHQDRQMHKLPLTQHIRAAFWAGDKKALHALPGL